MKTILMTSGAVAVAAVAAMVWGAQPARSSQDWLAKAQSEFATKARDAVIQRQIGKTSNGFDSAPVVVASVSPELSTPVADPAPVIATTTAQAPSLPPAAEPAKNMTVASASADIVLPSRSEAIAFAAPAREEITVPSPVQADTHDVALPEPAAPVAPQPVVATMPQAAPVTPSAIAPAEPTIKRTAQPSVAETAPQATAPQKTHHVAKSAPARTSRRPVSNGSMEERGLEALRQRAPELAAMVRSYM